MLSAILSMAIASPTAFVFRDKVEIRGGYVTLGAVADLAVLPPELRKRAETLSLLKIQPASRELLISHERLASRARSLMPTLAAWLPPVNGGAVRINSDAAQSRYAVAACGTGVAKGAVVAAVINANWFRVERQVEAVQDGRVGGLFFGRTPEGEVMQIYCEGGK